MASANVDENAIANNDKLTNSRQSCSNDPDFAVICVFFQKFAKDLGLDLPNFKDLQEWLTNTDEVAKPLSDLHIKLLRKNRKTVHEQRWESALKNFCFTYSQQDAWELERFGYKKSSIKVKLRILRELLESQFERNPKFRAKILTVDAESLRCKPIGRDRLGHSYWLTKDDDCNLRIYQEHLDEEIWQLVASNREEFVKLITQLKGNEVVTSISNDIGIVDEDTSSSNDCQAKAPPPEEKEDESQEESPAENKVPNLRIKLNAGKGEEDLAQEEDAKCAKKLKAEEDLEEDFESEFEEDAETGAENNDSEVESESEPEEAETKKPSTNKQKDVQHNKKVKPLLLKMPSNSNSPASNSGGVSNTNSKRKLQDADKSSPTPMEVAKKPRPCLMDSKRVKNPSKFGNNKNNAENEQSTEGEEEEDEEEEEEEEEEEGEEENETEAEFDENEIEENDDDDEQIVGAAIEDPAVIVKGEGSGKACKSPNPLFMHNEVNSLYSHFQIFDISEEEFSETIEETVFYVQGEGSGENNQVGNPSKQEETKSSTTPTPAATFFFGQPGCLQLSPIKSKPKETEKIEKNKTDIKDNSKTQQEEASSSKAEDQSKDLNGESSSNEVSKKHQQINPKDESMNEFSSTKHEKDNNENNSLEKLTNEKALNKHEQNTSTSNNETKNNSETNNKAQATDDVSQDVVQSLCANNECENVDKTEQEIESSKSNSQDKTDNESNSTKSTELDTKITEKSSNADKSEVKTIESEKEQDNNSEIPTASSENTNKCTKESPKSASQDDTVEKLEKQISNDNEIDENKTDHTSSHNASNEASLSQTESTLSTKEEASKTESSPNLTESIKHDDDNSCLEVPKDDCIKTEVKSAMELIESEEKIKEKTETLTAATATKSAEVSNSSLSNSLDLNIENESESLQQKLDKQKSPAKEIPKENAEDHVTSISREKSKNSLDNSLALDQQKASAISKDTVLEQKSDKKQNTEKLEVKNKSEEEDTKSLEKNKLEETNNENDNKSLEEKKQDLKENNNKEKQKEENEIKSLEQKKEDQSEGENMQNQKNEEEDVVKSEKITESLDNTLKTAIDDCKVTDVLGEKALNIEENTNVKIEEPKGVELEESKKDAEQEPLAIKTHEEKPVISSTSHNTSKVPLTPMASISTSAACVTLPNRKRRLVDLVAKETFKPPQSQTSESEIDHQSDFCADNLNEEDDLDVGGKRLKMRPKLTNVDLRKKVEAQKMAVDETSSSGGEENALRRGRKIITPKRQMTTASKADKTPEQAKPEVIATSSSGAVKHKPTLAEIIEKKLKKSPEVVEEDNNVFSKSLVAPTAVVAQFSPPKKAPITKPLKKNLLTQLRQEESDEEAIPRKRTISESVTPPTPVAAEEQCASSEEVQKTTPLNMQRKTPERQRKRRSSEEIKPAASEITETAMEQTPVISEKLKKSNDEQHSKSLTRTETMDSETKVEVKKVEQIEVKESAESKNKIVTTEKEKKDTNEVSPPTRRSGRRGAGAVLYAELPQPKRTRGVNAKTPIKKEEKVEEATKEQACQKEDKAEEQAKETKEIIKTEQNEQSIKSTTEATSECLTKVQENSKSKGAKTAAKKLTPAAAKAKSNEKDSEQSKTKPAPASTPAAAGRSRKKQDVDAGNIIEATDSETPVRQSRRIAQLKIKEEAERRKLEEIALRTMKQELKKKKKAEKEADPTVAEPSEESSSSEAESEKEIKRKAKKKMPGKDGWSSGSEEQDEPEEEEPPPHYETDPGSPLFKSDHEFSCESDVEDESQVVPMKRARTARKEDAAEGEDEGDEEACQKCGKSDHPEWILLCDKCDKGYHCSCLSPVLFYIPEGDWFCPPCQQEELIEALEKQLQEFDDLVEIKHKQEIEEKRLAEQAELERLEIDLNKKVKRRKETGAKSKATDSENSESDSEDESERSDKKKNADANSDNEQKGKKNKDDGRDKSKRRRGDGRSRRRAATRSSRRSKRAGSGSGSDSDSGSESGSESSKSSSATDSDDEPIYKLRKRRQINVSYRLTEYDDLINSALKKEMDKDAATGNLGRGKDINTILEAEADKEEQDRQKKLNESGKDDKEDENEKTDQPEKLIKSETKQTDEDSEDEPIKRKAKPKPTLKKKSRKLTTLDISSEEDNGSDADFKTSDESNSDEDTSVSVSSNNSDSSLEFYRRKGGKKKQRKAARRAARERRKDKKFVVDDSDDEDDLPLKPKTRKKRKSDSDYTETDETGDLSELSENVDSADLCDDTSTDDTDDGAWRPSNKRKKNKSKTAVARKSPKLKKPQVKKPKRVEYSDDDISETEEEEDEDDDDVATGGKGSGKQPRSQPLKTTSAPKGKGKEGGKAPRGKGSATSKKKKKKSSAEESASDNSIDSTRRTRGRRYAYIEDFDDDSSDGGIKPGVQRPDTPPEEREKFIKRQEEIKRMLAEKNAEGAKLAATPRLTPIKSTGPADKRSPAKPGDSLSTVPLSVIRQAKVLDIDYLQRKGENVDDLDDVDSEFDDADLPDDFPEDMDEDTIARMVEEEEFGAAAAARELPPPDEILKTPVKSKNTAKDVANKSINPAAAAAIAVAAAMNPSLSALSQMPGASPSGLQEPMRKRLPMPTMHPPLLRHQYPPHAGMHSHMTQRGPSAPLHPSTMGSSHLLQTALSAPLRQPLNPNYPPQHAGQAAAGQHLQRMPLMHPHMSSTRQPLPPSKSIPTAAGSAATPTPSSGTAAATSEPKPRGRRKKITPLRDPAEKQQAAAAAAASASQASQAASPHSEDAANAQKATPPAAVGVIKSSNPKPTAAPPQLYKTGPPSMGGEQPSVITRMPSHLTMPSQQGRPPIPHGMYPQGADLSRFYGPPGAGMRPHHAVPTSAAHLNSPQGQRQVRGPPPNMPSTHAGMRPTYGPPPPLRTALQASHSLSGTSERTTPGAGPPEHHGTPYAGGPPPARHASPHLNPYRPPLYGNHNYGPPPGMNLRPGAPPSGAGYPPFGYYPPPPLSLPPPTSHSQTAIPSNVPRDVPPTQKSLPPAPTSAPSSVIVSASAAASGEPSSSADKKLATLVEPKRKIMTLESLSSKSPSRNSPASMQHESGDDENTTSTTPAAGSGDNTEAVAETAPAPPTGSSVSEFSGLVSYFSSQHDDYTT